VADKTIPLPNFGDITGEITTTGLTTSGLVTEVVLSSVSWTALPASPLAKRNAISIQNESGIKIKLNFATPAGFVGVSVNDGGERFYNITDQIIIYAKSASGTPTVTVEEVA
jgi:hypothetical protein